jgi:hypothetical protein
MTKRVTWIALALALPLAVAGLAGCGQLSVLPDGRVALDWGEPTTAAEILGTASPGAGQAAPVLQAFDAAEGGSGAAADPNSRAGANCAGGVCAIY